MIDRWNLPLSNFRFSHMDRLVDAVLCIFKKKERVSSIHQRTERGIKGKKKEKGKRHTYMKRIVESQIPIQAVHLVHLVPRKAETEKVNILPLPGQIVALGNNAHVALDAPPQQHLRGRLTVLVRDPGDGGVFKQQGGPVSHGLLVQLLRGPGAEGPICRHGDVVPLRESGEAELGQVWVDLDLQGRGRDLGVAQHVEDQLAVEIADADAPRQSIFD